MKFPPDVWGPFYWHVIHIVALGYPKTPTYSDKKAAKEFFESLQFLLPCSVCRKHYTQHFQNNPITPALDTRDALIKWTIDIHNQVNKMLNKPVWTQDEVIAYYMRLGKIGRSPVWTSSDFAAADTKAFARGAIIGGAATLLASAAIAYSLGLLADK
jgi:hypothetical protein